jgi:hypothetical protein
MRAREIIARDGREAIERFQEGYVDIALLDLNIDDLLCEPVEGRLSRFTCKRPATRYLVSESERSLDNRLSMFEIALSFQFFAEQLGKIG